MDSPSDPPPRVARREAARRARDAFPPMGIYAIRDLQSGRVLLGASRNVHASLNRARFELRMRSHSDRVLQAAWNSSGPERFSFEVVELLKERADPDFDYASELKALEQIHRELLAQAGGKDE
ncbi:GIY-YIG nuclease family protein [Ramlibacter sp. G-1-2-2]|uniref:GIY-YIG nuclease family protein n=1 Tax=Ramlibacter agri TaxID=2728837 RepID=A0A848H5S3_9BURK|nr:GIY-YIG nuclease family protein [Ramlibacter agri]NML44869.1 GIY-YIG nuclease family protein [Ramlibacter agri]